MAMNDSDRKVIVTGAASGIGRAIARRFAATGAQVACLDADAANLAQTIEEFRAAGYRTIGLSVDLGDAAAAAASGAAAIAQLGGADVLINNAGINAGGTVGTLEVEQWNRVLAVNLTSMFVMSKAVWSTFAAQRRGAIVNMSSIMGLTPVGNSVAYCTSKGAIVAFTRSLAADGGPLGIRANCVCPGFVQTPIMDQAHGPEAQRRISAQLPMRRMASADEIADGFLYLASDAASYANGTTLVLDGAATTGFAGCYVATDS